MGFSKFALLATMGELLCLRMRAGEWVKPVGLGWRMLVWGVIGAAIALMFQVFNVGAREVMDQGLLPGKGTPLQTLATAFWISTVMNVTFGPLMMCAQPECGTVTGGECHDGLHALRRALILSRGLSLAAA